METETEEKKDDLNDILDSPEKISDGTLYLGENNIEVSLLNFYYYRWKKFPIKRARAAKNWYRKKIWIALMSMKKMRFITLSKISINRMEIQKILLIKKMCFKSLE